MAERKPGGDPSAGLRLGPSCRRPPRTSPQLDRRRCHRRRPHQRRRQRSSRSGIREKEIGDSGRRGSCAFDVNSHGVLSISWASQDYRPGAAVSARGCTLLPSTRSTAGLRITWSPGLTPSREHRQHPKMFTLSNGRNNGPLPRAGGVPPVPTGGMPLTLGNACNRSAKSCIGIFRDLFLIFSDSTIVL
jgi:hypothetical protein